MTSCLTTYWIYSPNSSTNRLSLSWNIRKAERRVIACWKPSVNMRARNCWKQEVVKSFVDRHLAYFVKLAEQAEPELYRSNQVFWLNRLDDEIDNLRMALEWALINDVEAGLRIAAIPWRFWLVRRLFSRDR